MRETCTLYLLLRACTCCIRMPLLRQVILLDPPLRFCCLIHQRAAGGGCSIINPCYFPFNFAIPAFALCTDGWSSACDEQQWGTLSSQLSVTSWDSRLLCWRSSLAAREYGDMGHFVAAPHAPVAPPGCARSSAAPRSRSLAAPPAGPCCGAYHPNAGSPLPGRRQSSLSSEGVQTLLTLAGSAAAPLGQSGHSKPGAPRALSRSRATLKTYPWPLRIFPGARTELRNRIACSVTQRAGSR